MDFQLDEDQRALRDALDRLLQGEYSFEQRALRLRSGEGVDRAAWRHFAELGVLALPFPEALGGLGGGAVEAMVVAESMGRAMVLEPYLATVVLAGGVLRAAGGPMLDRWAPRIAEGAALLAFATEEAQSRWRLDSVETSSERTSEGWRLDGGKLLVLHGAQADALIVSARGAEGLSLFMVPTDAEGVSVRGYRGHDGIALADVRLEGVMLPRGAVIGEEGGGLPLLRRATDAGIAFVASEAVGLMQRLLDTTVAYLGTRKQFGVVLGSFQALQHAAADMLVATEIARSMAYYATSMRDEPDESVRTRALSAVKVQIGRCARTVAHNAVQLHGAIGMTEECDVSHAFRRLTAIDGFLGDADHHLSRYALQG